MISKELSKRTSKLVLLLCCITVVCACLCINTKGTFALGLSVDFVTRDKDNQWDVREDEPIYAKEATQEKIKTRISDTRRIDFIYLAIQANDYKSITIKNDIQPEFIEVLDVSEGIIYEGVYYYELTKNATYTIEAMDKQDSLVVEIPLTIIGEFGERDTESPVILSLEYDKGNFILEAIDFKPGLYGIFEDNDDMNQIMDLSSYGNKANVVHRKESGGYWIRVYDGDDNYSLCKLTGSAPRIQYCYKKGDRLKLKAYDSIGLWKITGELEGQAIKTLKGKETELTIKLPSDDISCIYVYNHANNYTKIDLEEYLDAPDVTKAYKNGTSAVLTAKAPVGLLKVTESMDGDTILRLMGKNVTVRFNLSDDEITNVYVYDEFDNVAKVELKDELIRPTGQIIKDGDEYILKAFDELSGIWKITDTSTDRLLKHYIRQDYPTTIIEKVSELPDVGDAITVYDYAGNSVVCNIPKE